MYSATKKLLAATALITGLAGACPTHASSAPAYTITDLGVLSNTDRSVAIGLNNHGDVVGSCSSGDSRRVVGFLYRNGKMFGITGTDGYQQTSPLAVNDADVVVGQIENSKIYKFDAFIFHHGTLKLITSDGASWAPAINSSGEIVVNSEQSGASVYKNGVTTTIPAVIDGDYLTGYSINDSGDVVGEEDFFGSESTSSLPFIYEHGDTYSLGGSTTNPPIPLFIDKYKNIVGERVNQNFNQYAVIRGDKGWTGVDPADLSGGDSDAIGIDNAGDIVGNNNGLGFVYTSAGNFEYLDAATDPTLGWSNITARGVNVSGQICGFGNQPGKNTHAVLLTPSR